MQGHVRRGIGDLLGVRRAEDGAFDDCAQLIEQSLR